MSEVSTVESLAVEAGALTHVCRADGVRMGHGVSVLGRGSVRSMVPGACTLTTPLVVPRTAKLLSCRVSFSGDVPCELLAGESTSTAAGAGEEKEIVLGAEQLMRMGRGFVIPSVPFVDFREYPLAVRMDAPATHHARLTLRAMLQFELPAESGSDYLNYIMAQA